METGKKVSLHRFRADQKIASSWGKKCVFGIAHPFTVSSGHGSLRLDANARLLGLCRMLVAVLGLRGREKPSAVRADLDPLTRQQRPQRLPEARPHAVVDEEVERGVDASEDGDDAPDDGGKVVVEASVPELRHQEHGQLHEQHRSHADHEQHGRRDQHLGQRYLADLLAVPSGCVLGGGGGEGGDLLAPLHGGAEFVGCDGRGDDADDEEDGGEGGGVEKHIEDVQDFLVI